MSINRPEVLFRNMSLSPTKETIQERIERMDVKFHYLCDQLRILNVQIENKQRRYEHSNRMGRRGVRYSLRLQLSVAEGVRNMFYQHALYMADTLDDLRTQSGYVIIGRGW